MPLIINLFQINVSYGHLPMLNRHLVSFDRTNRIVIVPGGKIIDIWQHRKYRSAHVYWHMRRVIGNRVIGIGLTETHRFHDASSVVPNSRAT